MAIINHESLTTLSRQVLAAWGVAAEHAAVAAENLVAADLCGIDSHGVHMLPVYEQMYAQGRVHPHPQTHISQPAPGLTNINAGGGLGHYAGRTGMSYAIHAAKQHGFGITSVCNSGHFGAAGIYALQASDEGMLGIAMSSVAKLALAPSGSRRPWFGTNPIAFAAPSAGEWPFLLDMATTTASIGRIMRSSEERTNIPAEWALDRQGVPTIDPDEALATRLLTPLGSTDAGSSYKGYGLAAMVEILCTFLGGSTWAAYRDEDSSTDDVGHFFLVLDPTLFRAPNALQADVSRMQESLRHTPTFEEGKCIHVPGDRELSLRNQRLREGIPVRESVLRSIRDLAGRAGVDANYTLRSTTQG